MRAVRGVFITIEGGEGVGKSTQSHRLAGRLRDLGRTVTVLHEPGYTEVGDRIRSILLDPEVTMEPRTELFLFEAARAELTEMVIAPALDLGEVVVCDRFYDSTTAYQAHGRGLDADLVASLNRAATAGLQPDITVYLALPVNAAMRRATRDGADRMEAESLEFHRRVIDGFEAIAAGEPERVVRIDASGDVAQVADRVWDAVASHPAVGALLNGFW